jgi:predicted metal-dependent phosphoesterase TrpH
MSAAVDLHLHTTASDGRLSPTELIQLVASQGLQVVSVTDHDTTEGLAEAYRAAREFPNLRIIPGIEFSTDIPGDEIHMLGYFIQYEEEEFQGILLRFRNGRLERARLMVEKLATMGITVEWERVQEIAGDGAVGRPHIALAMMEKGYIQEPREAFIEHLGRNGTAYVERKKVSPTEAIQILAQVGGVAVLAHPSRLLNMDARIEELKAAGLTGMEVHYAEYSPETVEYLAGVAARYDLIPCGGSDYHGLGNKGEPLPGTLGPPMDTVERLEYAAHNMDRAATA